MKKLQEVTLKNGDVISVLPEEVPGLKRAGLLKEEKKVGQTKEEKSTGETKQVKGHATRTGGKKPGPKKRPVNISHANIKGENPKKT